jgi:uncharacterized protein
VRVERNTQNVAAARTFYQSMFAWTLNDVEMGGGMMQHSMPGAPSMWLPYVLVDDIVAGILKAKSLGATMVRDVMQVMDEGSLSIVINPASATLGDLAAEDEVTPVRSGGTAVTAGRRPRSSSA